LASGSDPLNEVHTSVNITEVKQLLFENARDAQVQYFNSIIQIVERLEVKIKILEEQKTKLEIQNEVLEGIA